MRCLLMKSAVYSETDSSGNTVSNAGNSIVVKVTNLCPGEHSIQLFPLYP